MAVLKRDPTRTTTLRNKLSTLVRKRFMLVRKQIVNHVYTEDAYGLQPQTTQQTFNVERRAFQFLTDDQKVKHFRGWLKERVDAGILEVDPEFQARPWLAPQIESAYKKGAVHAYIAARGADEAQAAFLAQSFASPVATSKIELLATRAFQNLEGVTNEMSKNMNRIFADGIAHGVGPREIARQLSKGVDKIVRTRALTLARTEIIHAHAEGSIDHYEKLGIKELGAQIEFSTANDDRVCPICQSLEGEIYTTEQARGVIPVHPNCRCAWIPSFEKPSQTRPRRPGGPRRSQRSERRLQKASGGRASLNDIKSMPKTASVVERFKDPENTSSPTGLAMLQDMRAKLMGNPEDSFKKKLLRPIVGMNADVDYKNYVLKSVKVSDVKPSQFGEDYINASSEYLAENIKVYRATDRRADYFPIVLDDAMGIIDGNHRHAAHVLGGVDEMLALVPKSLLKTTADDGIESALSLVPDDYWGNTRGALIRWMGKEGWTNEETAAFFTGRGVAVNKGSLYNALRDGRKGLRGVPDFTDEQLEILRACKDVKPGPGPPPKPKPPKPPVPKPPSKKTKRKPIQEKRPMKVGKKLKYDPRLENDNIKRFKAKNPNARLIEFTLSDKELNRHRVDYKDWTRKQNQDLDRIRGIESADAVPPIIVEQDGKSLLVTDGFHRAAISAGNGERKLLAWVVIDDVDKLPKGTKLLKMPGGAEAKALYKDIQETVGYRYRRNWTGLKNFDGTMTEMQREVWQAIRDEWVNLSTNEQVLSVQSTMKIGRILRRHVDADPKIAALQQELDMAEKVLARYARDTENPDISSSMKVEAFRGWKRTQQEVVDLKKRLGEGRKEIYHDAVKTLRSFDAKDTLNTKVGTHHHLEWTEDGRDVYRDMTAAEKVRAADYAEEAQGYLPDDWTQRVTDHNTAMLPGGKESPRQIEMITAERGFQRGGRLIAVSDEAAQPGLNTTVHEFTHLVDDTDIYMNESNVEFLKWRIKRTKDPKKRRQTLIYKDKNGKKEMGYEDDFGSHYAGKVYGTIETPFATEIGTMGLESFWFNKNQVKIFEDETYLDYITGLLLGF